MTARAWQVGIVGTFDVENYGDLLFPMVAEAELCERLGALVLHRFSYHAKTPPAWPYAVRSLTELPAAIGQLDALLIGGGFLIRFDKRVADGYGPPSPEIHHPTGYWLTPALMAIANGVPVVWNAPGMHRNAIPDWAEPLLELLLGGSAYIAVRDEPSRATLARFVAPERITVMPDTAFGVAGLLPKSESPALQQLRARIGLNRPYLIVQPVRWADDGFPPFLAEQRARFADYELVALPIGPVLGDDNAFLGEARQEFLELPFWPDPLLLAELIANASAVIGYSYHLAITALAAGVPVFTSVDLSAGKFTALREFATVYPLASIAEGADTFFARLGKREVEPGVHATLEPLAGHWDRVAETIRTSPREVPVAANRFWQTLPTLLEDRAKGDPMIKLQDVAAAKLQSEPYQWAAIDGLYSPHDGLALAETFPVDHYKRVEAYGGEKDYAYDARLLIGMGARTIAYREHLSDAWQRLADDLRSPEYREAISALTGVDLSDALLEVNVFHYGPGASLGAHPDLPDKLVTHVLYFNRTWNVADGGCLTILRSKDAGSVVATIPPVVGNSALLVRSDESWHAVSPVVTETPLSRRSLTATFYRPGSTSSMWPDGDETPLRDYTAPPAPPRPLWRRVASRVRRRG